MWIVVVEQLLSVRVMLLLIFIVGSPSGIDLGSVAVYYIPKLCAHIIIWTNWLNAPKIPVFAWDG